MSGAPVCRPTPKLPVRTFDRHVRHCGRLETRHRKTVGRRDQHKIARRESQLPASVNREQTRSLEDDTVERPPVFRATDLPTAGCAYDFGERRIWF